MEVREFTRNIFLDSFNEKVAERKVGLELGFPVVREYDFQYFDVTPLFNLLGKNRYSPIFDDYYKNQVIGVKDKEGRVVTTDAGVGTLELALVPRCSIKESPKRRKGQ